MLAVYCYAARILLCCRFTAMLPGASVMRQAHGVVFIARVKRAALAVCGHSLFLGFQDDSL